jgi:hypothetical protein
VARAAAPGTYHVKECYPAWGWGTFPLRYGNTRFGYRHIKARHGWTGRTRRSIERSLLYGYQELQGDRVVP